MAVGWLAGRNSLVVAPTSVSCICPGSPASSVAPFVVQKAEERPLELLALVVGVAAVGVVWLTYRIGSVRAEPQGAPVAELEDVERVGLREVRERGPVAPKARARGGGVVG